MVRAVVADPPEVHNAFRKWGGGKHNRVLSSSIGR